MVASFDGDYKFLSNFYDSKITIDGITFDNGEAAFHSFKDMSRRREFEGLTASMAKKLGRKVKLRSDWESIKDLVMYTVVKAKFTQNPLLKEKLLATGDQKLIEGNHWHDTYWGVCDGVGKNTLGIILMQVRKELRETK